MRLLARQFKNIKSQLTSKLGKNTAGFTMVEVIVAMTLLGTTMTAIFYVLRTCSTISNHTRMLTGSVLLAESLFTETRLNENTAFETKEGEEGLYSWETKLVSTSIDNLGALHIVVKWKEQQRQQQYELFSLIQMKSITERR